jgi:hypothetical protein
MKTFIITFALIMSVFISKGQDLKRLPNETAIQLAERLKPENSKITHQVIETIWNSKSVIFAFYNQNFKLPKDRDPEQQDYLRIIGTIFLKQGNSGYKRIIIDTLDTEGGNPSIESFFFANADKDSLKELVIIASWEQRHYDVNGTLYDSTVYDNITGSTGDKLTLKTEISKRIDGGCDCVWQDGRKKTVKFKTAKSIKEELSRLGY